MPTPEQIRELMTRALASHQRRDYVAAEAGYRRVLHLKPTHSDANHFLGLLAHQTGRTQDALVLLGRAVELEPSNPLYRHNLAGVYKELGEFAQAERVYRQTLEIKAGYLDAWIGLALVEAEQGKYSEALSGYECVLAVDARHYAAGLGRARLLHEMAREYDALQAYSGLARLWDNDVMKLSVVGLGLREAGGGADAVTCLRRAVALDPDYSDARNALGITLADMGDLEGAEACYREVLRRHPDHVGALHNLANLVRLGPEDPLWSPLMALAQTAESLLPKDAVILHFALGKVWEDAGDFERAFRHFAGGNRLKRAEVDYNEDRQTRFIRNFIHYFDTDFMAAHAGLGVDDAVPVFIVGMSRSGTTLVEQILASHPQVFGAGEIQHLWRCLRVELGTPANQDDYLPALLNAEDGLVFERVAKRYISLLKSLAPDAKRITNKLPGNMTLVGFIHIAFPNAKIIHCVRDPMDTCMSCYSKLFTHGHLFSYELGELGRFYRLHEDLMQHWRAVLPDGSMLEVRYEDVVADFENQVRRLLAYCDLPWDDACLRFYAAARAVGTASVAQVRQPLYSSSVGRWKRYAKHLGALKQALGRE